MEGKGPDSVRGPASDFWPGELKRGPARTRIVVPVHCTTIILIVRNDCTPVPTLPHGNEAKNTRFGFNLIAIFDEKN